MWARRRAAQDGVEVVSRAFPYVTTCGFAVAAIDAPGTGDRPEPRITAAVLGLIGSDWLIDTAARITIPVEFLLQWDDEGNPRASVMRLFEALGSAEKTCTPTPAVTSGCRPSRSTAPSASSPGT
ncbi:hypothetical protein ABZW11_07850 [Nonomuraea sp. NPDC004580]|uniref:hypothetical protein n=1 Tax=Nonomuraea sp. NPDC004580 TaxID=3154552 RepID=UPI0033A0071C